MTQLVVGVADGKISQGAQSSLVTYALGSCVAIALCDPVNGVGGLVHFMLPESSLDAGKAERNPWMFADTGIPLLFRMVLENGAERRRLKIWAAGGSQVMDPEGVFNIGKRNCLAARKLLWKAGAMMTGEDVGGSVSRTIRLDVASGQCFLRIPGIPERRL